MILLEDQKIKIFLQKVTLRIGQRKFLWLKKLKMLCCRHILLVTLTGKKLLERFTKKNCKKKGDRLYVKLEGYDNLFNSWIDKKRQLHLFKFV